MHKLIGGRIQLYQCKNIYRSSMRFYSQFDKELEENNCIRIGCASGFWGDTATAAQQLVHNGELNYLVFDYLSEITMSLLAAAKKKDSNFGYAPDFVHFAIGPLLNDIKRNNIKVISNAGGINPHSCAESLKNIASKSGIDLKVAVITGDDLIDKIDQIEISEKIPTKMSSINAYFGAFPIAEALKKGADIVVTGRCVDSALALGPLIYEYKWNSSDLNKLAMGSLAGHLIECGAQSTGGIFTDWHTVPDWHNIGFPIVECSSNGKFVLTKPPKTGGLVNTATISEQLVYEIGDPKNYILPDVVCDFSNVKLRNLDSEAVLVTGALGKPPPAEYKVCSTFMDGYKATAVCCVGGMKSVEKGRKTADAILKRVKNIFKILKLEDFLRTHVQVIGSEETYGKYCKQTCNPREAVIWISVHHNDKKALQLFTREVAAAGTGMAPGLTSIVGGRPTVSPLLRLFSFNYPKEKFDIEISIDNDTTRFINPKHSISNFVEPKINETCESVEMVSIESGKRLEDLAYARSGDKGNDCNIGVISRKPEYYQYLKDNLTAVKVYNYFQHVFDINDVNLVQRYELPGVYGLNFVLKDSLGGGGVASLRTDPQGKAFAQMLLDFEFC